MLICNVLSVIQYKLHQAFINILKMHVCWLSSLLRSAKGHILGLSRVSSAGDVEKTDLFTDDSLFEETIIAEYALVINGHSLVRCSHVLHYIVFSFVGMML